MNKEFYANYPLCMPTNPPFLGYRKPANSELSVAWLEATPLDS